MTTYLTIMVTVLVATQVIRITQNHISLRRQAGEIRKTLKWFDEQDISEKDFETQRMVFKLLREKLEREMEPERKCDNCGWISENGLYEGGGEAPCIYCDNHELWIAKEEQNDRP